MNIKQLKLALTVDLLNKPNYKDPVDFTLERMDDYSGVTGDFQGASQPFTSELNDTMERKTMALEFEHYTLNMDFIHDKNKKEDYLQTFDFQER